MRVSTVVIRERQVIQVKTEERHPRKPIAPMERGWNLQQAIQTMKKV